MTQKSSKIPNFDAVLYKNENNRWFQLYGPPGGPQGAIHDSKYGTTRA